MIKKFFKNNFVKIKTVLSKDTGNKLIAKLKMPEFLGVFSIALAIGIAIYAFADLDVAVKRGPLLTKLFGTEEQRKQRLADKQLALLEATVLPQSGVTLPVVWGDLCRQLMGSGVIDADKFEKLYASRGGLSEEDKKLLCGVGNGNLIITEQNSGLLLNMLWALGLGNKNEILEKGPMMDKRFGGTDRFASTGGWSLAEGNVMQHYSMHHFLNLTPEQQGLVRRASLNIYRPCCNNPTYFPDCNHGMAMLGLLELMASQGVGEQEMYESALAVNAFWFPDNYLTIAKYLESRGLSWTKTEPKALLGTNFSSSSGYRQILSQINPPTQQNGGSCGI